MPMMEADGLEALHVAESIEALGDVLGAQADIIQLHGLQRFQVGDAGPVNVQLQRHVL